MRRRHPRRDGPPPEAWIDAMVCRDPEWLAIRDGLERTGGPAERVDAAWWEWPGRAAWHQAHPELFVWAP